MTFIEIVNAVLADAFDDSKRAAAQTWVNHRYTWLCDLEPWSFMIANPTVTVTSSSMSVTGLPTNLGPVIGLLDQYGNPLEAVRDIETFYERYTGLNNTATGQPEAYTVIGSSVLVGPTSNYTGSFQMIHEQVAAQLSNDSDTPIIPTGYHMGLVHGGKAEGFRLTNIPLADQFDADFRGTIDVMKAKYLAPVRDKQRQSPAYR